MKLIRKKNRNKNTGKNNNGVMTLLRKLKRHDTMVVAVAVVIALILCGGLIYISTPVVAAEAREEFVESEKENNELTKEKLQEIRDYLDDLDKVVTSNQESLNSIDDKTSSENEKVTNNINDRVTKLDGKLTEVHRNIDSTITRIDNVKSELDAADKQSAEQLKKDFAEIGNELVNIQKEYEDVTGQTKSLLTQLNKELADSLDSSTDEITGDIKEKNAALISKLNTMYEQMEQFNTNAFGNFKSDIEDLGSNLGTQLQDIDSDIQNYNTDVKNKFDDVNNSVSNKFDDVNNTVTNKFDTVNNTVSNKFKEINETMNSQTNAINNLISESSSKNQENSKTLENKIDAVAEKVNQVFQRVSEGKKLLASTLLTYNVTVSEDAKFQQISDGIKELGDQKVNRDGVIAAAKASATSDKIMAGQSVLIDDLTIEGTATGDADASAGDILTGKSAYVNGQKVTGEIPIKDLGNIVLTSSNSSQHFEAGYYEAFTVTSDVSTIAGSVKFQVGHHHLGNERSGTGCYTTLDESRSWSCGQYLHLDQVETTSSNGFTNYTMEGTCWKCGRHYKFNHDHSDTYQCSTGEAYYLLSCGHEEGELVRETEDINDVGSNEKLLSATITMD